MNCKTMQNQNVDLITDTLAETLSLAKEALAMWSRIRKEESRQRLEAWGILMFQRLVALDTVLCVGPLLAYLKTESPSAIADGSVSDGTHLDASPDGSIFCVSTICRDLKQSLVPEEGYTALLELATTFV